jgi:hypothetical protein
VGFRRAARVVLARWLPIVAVALVFAAGAVSLATLYNHSIKPRFEATAGVTFLQLDRETDAAFAARLDAARSRALSITAADAYAAQLDVEADSASGTVSFIVDATSDASARELATRFRDEYLTAEPSSAIVEQISSRLASIRTEVADLNAQLATRQPAAPAVSPDTAALSNLVISRLSELRQQEATLSLQLAVPDLAEADAITLQDQLSATQKVISELENELTGLSSSPTTAATSATTVPSDLDALVLQRRVDDLESQYVDLSLRLVDLGTTGDLNGIVTVVDRTASPVGRRTAGAAGLVVGLLASIGLVLLVEAIRRPLRHADDVTDVRSLGVVDPAASNERGLVAWYEKDTRTERKRQIQSVRSALGDVVVAGSSLGVTPVRAGDDDVRLFAADLAASIAATDRNVLLIDATFTGGVPIAEYGTGSVTLTDIVAVDDRKAALRGVAETMDCLRGLPSGSGGGDPADLVAGVKFSGLLEDAASMGLVVIVAIPAPDSAVSEGLAQRLDQMLIVGRAKKMTARSLMAVVDAQATRHAGVAGVVLITGSEKLKPRSKPVRRRSRPAKPRRAAKAREPDTPPFEEEMTVEAPEVAVAPVSEEPETFPVEEPLRKVAEAHETVRPLRVATPPDREVVRPFRRVVSEPHTPTRETAGGAVLEARPAGHPAPGPSHVAPEPAHEARPTVEFAGEPGEESVTGPTVGPPFREVVGPETHVPMQPFREVAPEPPPEMPVRAEPVGPAGEEPAARVATRRPFREVSAESVREPQSPAERVEPAARVATRRPFREVSPESVREPQSPAERVEPAARVTARPPFREIAPEPVREPQSPTERVEPAAKVASGRLHEVARGPVREMTPARHIESGTIAKGRHSIGTLGAGEMQVDESLRVVVPDPERSVAAERFLAAAVKALVDAPGGLADVPRQLVDVEGMVPITQGLGSLTVAERLVRFLPDLVGATPRVLADAVHEVLGCRVGVDSVAVCRERLDAWVRQRFDVVSSGPVWHLSSGQGSVQLIVNGGQFDIERLRLLRAHDLRRFRARLARVVPDDDSADELADATAFDSALRGLVEEAEGANGSFDWRRRFTETGLLVGRR